MQTDAREDASERDAQQKETKQKQRATSAHLYRFTVSTVNPTIDAELKKDGH